MDENRRFNRLYAEGAGKAVVTCAGIQDEAEILDVSAGGMRVHLRRSLDMGAVIYGEFKVFPKGGPFFVKGKVIRIAQKGNAFETVIEFEKVSTIPLAG